jgi:cell division protein FtsZ
MANAGSALMGIGSARGEDRSVAAAEMAVSSPLLEASIDGAHGVLLSIAGGSDLGLFEINEAAALVAESAHAEANIIFGATIDDALGDEVRVTVIAAGFDGGMPKRRDNGTVLRREPAPQQTQAETRAAAQAVSSQRSTSPQGQSQGQSQSQGQPSQRPASQQGGQQSGSNAASQGGQGGHQPAQRPAPSTTHQGQASHGQSTQQAQPRQAPQQQPRPQRQVQFDDDDLDIPDFLK